MSSVRGGRGSSRGRGTNPFGGQSNATRGAPRPGFQTRGARNARAGRATVRGASTNARKTTATGGSSRGQSFVSQAPKAFGGFGGADGNTHQQRYQALKTRRDGERADAIKRGFLADPDRPRTLAEAITPVGTCPDMCAEYERVERIVQKDVWGPETNEDGTPAEERMVKKFRRAAAGLDEQLPSDLRPPATLQKTIEYLFDQVIGNAESLGSVHHFVWDRTRAIRNDFSIQQITKPIEVEIAIECYERIARFHILSLHQFAVPEKPYDKYDWYQEREQLDRTLLSLMQYYDDSRGRVHCKNEAEFRAYCIIFQIQDPTPDLEERVYSWDDQVSTHPRVRTALDLYAAACNVLDAQGPLKPRTTHPVAREDWHDFFASVESGRVSYLMACVAEIYFNLVRKLTLNCIWRAYRRQGSSAELTDFTLDFLTDLLKFDDTAQTEDFCEHFGFPFKDSPSGDAYLDLNVLQGKKFPEAAAGLANQTFSDALVECKRAGRTYPAIIRGYSVAQAQREGMIEEEDAMEVQDMDMEEEEDSLFVPEQPKSAAVPAKSPFSGFGGVNGTSISSNPDVSPSQSPFSTGSGFQPSKSPFAFGLPSASPAGTGADTERTTPPATNAGSAWQPNPFAPSFGGQNDKAASEQKSTSIFAQTSASPAFGSSFGKPPAFTSGSFVKASSPIPEQPSKQNAAVEPPKENASPYAFSKTSIADVSGPSKSPFSGFNFSQPQSKPETSTTSAPNESAFGKPKGSPVSSGSVFDKPAAPSMGNTPPAFGQSIFSKPKEASPPPAQATTPETSIFAKKPAASEPSLASTPATSPFGRRPSESESVPAKDRTPTSSSFIPPSMSGTKSSEPLQAQNSAFQFSAPASTTSAPKVTFALSEPSPTGKETAPEISAPPKLPTFSFTQPNQPKRKSPLSQSYTAPETGEKVDVSGVKASESQPQQTKSPMFVPSQNTATSQNVAPLPAAKPKPKSPVMTPDQILQKLAEEVALDVRKGIVKQFVEFHARAAILSVYEELYTERMHKIADDFRRETLATRYGRRWREVSWHLRLARQGKEKRERRRTGRKDREERERKKKEQEKINAVDEFLQQSQNNGRSHNVSTSSGRFSTAAKGIGSTLSESTERRKRVSTTGDGDEQPALNGESQHKVFRLSDHVDSAGRVAKPSISPSTASKASGKTHFLGFSLRGSQASMGPPKPVARSSYFRMRAMGINPNGATVAPSQASILLSKKRTREDDDTPTASPAAKKSRTPPRTTTLGQSSRLRSESIQSRSSVLSISPAPQSAPSPRPRSSFEKDDDALFARARAARKAMADSGDWYRSQIQQADQVSIHTTSPHTASTSMDRARAEARLRASQRSDVQSNYFVYQAQPDVPAYRLRESRFVPRQHYTKAIEKSRERIESRSRPQSQMDMRDSEERSLTQPMASQEFSHTLGRSQLDEHADFGVTASVEKPDSLEGTPVEAIEAANYQEPYVEKPFSFKPAGAPTFSFGQPSLGDNQASIFRQDQPMTFHQQTNDSPFTAFQPDAFMHDESAAPNLLYSQLDSMPIDPAVDIGLQGGALEEFCQPSQIAPEIADPAQSTTQERDDSQAESILASQALYQLAATNDVEPASASVVKSQILPNAFNDPQPAHGAFRAASQARSRARSETIDLASSSEEEDDEEDDEDDEQPNVQLEMTGVARQGYVSDTEDAEVMEDEMTIDELAPMYPQLNHDHEIPTGEPMEEEKEAEETPVVPDSVKYPDLSHVHDEQKASIYASKPSPFSTAPSTTGASPFGTKPTSNGASPFANLFGFAPIQAGQAKGSILGVPSVGHTFGMPTFGTPSQASVISKVAREEHIEDQGDAAIDPELLGNVAELNGVADMHDKDQYRDEEQDSLMEAESANLLVQGADNSAEEEDEGEQRMAVDSLHRSADDSEDSAGEVDGVDGDNVNTYLNDEAEEVDKGSEGISEEDEDVDTITTNSNTQQYIQRSVIQDEEEDNNDEDVSDVPAEELTGSEDGDSEGYDEERDDAGRYDEEGDDEENGVEQSYDDEEYDSEEEDPENQAPASSNLIKGGTGQSVEDAFELSD